MLVPKVYRISKSLHGLPEHRFVRNVKVDAPRENRSLHNKIAILGEKVEHFLNQLVVNQDRGQIALNRAFRERSFCDAIKSVEKIWPFELRPLIRIS